MYQLSWDPAYPGLELRHRAISRLPDLLVYSPFFVLYFLCSHSAVQVYLMTLQLPTYIYCVFPSSEIELKQTSEVKFVFRSAH